MSLLKFARGLLFCALAASAPAQVITTVAGTDWVFPSTGLLPQDSPLGTITGVASDAKGNVYFADYDNCVVLRLSSNLNLDTVAGTGKCGYSGNNGPAIQAQLSGPAGVAVAPDGTLYFADSRNHVVRRVSTSGI